MAPEGFTYDPNSPLCAQDPIPSLNILLDNVSPPKFEDFIAYGVAEARNAVRDPASAAISLGTARATQSLAATGEVQGAAAIAGVTLAVVVAAAQGVTAAAVAAGIAVIIAAPVVVVILAIIALIVQTFFIVTEGEIPDKLQAALERAQSSPAPNLTELVETDEGKQDLFLVFIRSTLPDFPGLSAPPAVPSDPVFRVTGEHGDIAEAREKIQSFIDRVNALSGKSIEPEAADDLVAAAMLILGALPDE